MKIIHKRGGLEFFFNFQLKKYWKYGKYSLLQRNFNCYFQENRVKIDYLQFTKLCFPEETILRTI